MMTMLKESEEGKLRRLKIWAGELVRSRADLLWLDAVGNGTLHAIKEKEATQDDQQDGHGGNSKDEAWRPATTGDGPAESVDHSRHRV